MFQATIQAGTELLDVSIPTGGGTYEITTANHPYRGLKLTVPSGALTTPGSWQLRVLPNAAPPTLPAGYQVAGPILEVTTEQPRLDDVIILEIPVTVPTGRGVVIAFHDPVRRVTEVVPTVGRTATSIRVATTHLRADLLLGPTPSSFVAMMSSRLLPGIGQLIPIEFPLPMPEVPAVMNPADDRWPVAEHGSAQFPEGHGAAIAGLEALNFALDGPQLTTLVKRLEEPGFYGEAAPLGAVVTGHERIFEGLSNILNTLNEELRKMPKPERDDLVSQAMTANLAMRGATPAAMTTAANGQVAFGTAFASTGGTLQIVNHAKAQALTVGRNPATGFTPQQVRTTADGPDRETDGITPVNSLVLVYEKLGDLLRNLQQLPTISPAARAVLNKAMAEQAGLPAVPLETQVGTSGGWEPTPEDQVVIRSKAVTLRIPTLSGGVMINFPTSGAEIVRSNTSTVGLDAPGLNDLPQSTSTPVVVSPFVSIAGRLKQMSAHVLDAVRAEFKVEPETVELEDDLEVSFEASIPMPPAGGYRIRWEWDDGNTTESLSLPTATHTYEASGNYRVIATLLSMTRNVLAADTVEVGSQAAPYWRLTSFADQDDLLDIGNPGESGEIYDVLSRAVAVPGAGLIAIDPQGAGTVLRLRVLPTATWSTANCCPPAATLPGEVRQTLGVMPQEASGVGPYFAGWEASRWSQTTQDLGSGTLTGQYIMATGPYNIEDIGTQIGPRGGIRITATRNGKVMTGTIRITIWWVDETGQHLQGSSEDFVFPFTAERIR